MFTSRLRNKMEKQFLLKRRSMCFLMTTKNAYVRNICIIALTFIIFGISISFKTEENPVYIDDNPDVPTQFYKEAYVRNRIETGLPIEYDVVKAIPTQLEMKTPKRGEDNIMFIETSCVMKDEKNVDVINHELRLTYQQVCAIESAAKMNPRSQVYLFYTCPLNKDSLNKSSVLIGRLFDYPNVHVWHQTLYSLFQSTPLEEFYKSGQMQRSHFLLAQSSDVIRLLLLWKYGGIYLDLDFIITRSLASLGKNFAGDEGDGYIANGAMGMSTEGIGKEVADACVEELRTTFRGDIWSHNGPQLITRIMQRKCGIKKIHLMTAPVCDGFEVLPVATFYPIKPDFWEHLYSELNWKTTMSRINNSHGVHLWNSISRKSSKTISKDMIPGSKQPLALLREQFCPVVYNNIVIANSMVKLHKRKEIVKVAEAIQ